MTRWRSKYVGLFCLALMTVVYFPAISFSRQAMGSSIGAGEAWHQFKPRIIFQAETSEEFHKLLKKITPGTEVQLAAGEYAGINISLQGKAGAPIFITGCNRDKVRIMAACSRGDGINLEKSAYVILENITVVGMPRAGIRLADSHHIVVRNCRMADNIKWGIFAGFVDYLIIENNECRGSKREHGIYVSNSGDYVTVRGNQCHHNAGCGIQFNADKSCGGDGVISYCLIEANQCWENGRSGGAALNFDGVCDSIIRGNKCWDNHAGGIALFRGDASTGSSRNLVCKNIIRQPPDGRWCISIKNCSRGNEVMDNLLVTEHRLRGAINIDASSSGGLISQNNRVTPCFSLDGGDNRIGLQAWQNFGFGKGTIAALPNVRE